MSTSNENNMTLVVVLAVAGLGFVAHHTYQVDRWRCLVPSKKDWFRVLLTWMCIGSLVGFLIWGAGWCYVKYHLGWMIVPGYGPVPFPSLLWTEKWKGYNAPLTFWLSLAYWFQISLCAEEGLYWYHLMRAVRSPKSAKAWLTSSFFYTWIGISILSACAQFGSTWIGFKDMVDQAARMYTTAGILELVVVSASCIVIIKFPAFLADVKASGAGPEVRSRLHFYHEGNKIRTFFRFVFCIVVVIAGIDGLTEKKTINMNHIAADMLQQIAFGSYFLSVIISVVLYLPRNWSGNTQSARVFVAGGGPDRINRPDPISSNALMSLLREGGQWDEVDDANLRKTKAGSKTYDETYKKNWEEAPNTPRALENWMSPFGLQTKEEIPKQLKIHVQQEVHDDGDSAREER